MKWVTLTEYPDSSFDSLSQGAAWLIDRFPKPFDSLFTLLFSFLEGKKHHEKDVKWHLHQKNA
jgi:hypothetical protein